MWLNMDIIGSNIAQISYRLGWLKERVGDGENNIGHKGDGTGCCNKELHLVIVELQLVGKHPSLIKKMSEQEPSCDMASSKLSGLEGSSSVELCIVCISGVLLMLTNDICNRFFGGCKR